MIYTTGYRNRDWLNNEYTTLGKSMQTIATENGVCLQTIRHWLHTFQITARRPGRRPYAHRASKASLASWLADNHPAIYEEYLLCTQP